MSDQIVAGLVISPMATRPDLLSVLTYSYNWRDTSLNAVTLALTVSSLVAVTAAGALSLSCTCGLYFGSVRSRSGQRSWQNARSCTERATNGFWREARGAGVALAPQVWWIVELSRNFTKSNAYTVLMPAFPFVSRRVGT